MYIYGKNSLLSVLFWHVVLKLLIPKECTARWPGSSAGRGQCDVWARQLALTVPLPTQVSERVPLHLMLGGGGGIPAMDQHPRRTSTPWGSRNIVLPVVTCYGNRNTLTSALMMGYLARCQRSSARCPVQYCHYFYTTKNLNSLSQWIFNTWEKVKSVLHISEH